MSWGAPTAARGRSVKLALVWLLVVAGAMGSAMSLGLPAITAPIDGDSSGALTMDTERADPSLAVTVSRVDSTLVYDVTVENADATDSLRLDGAFGIYTVTASEGFVADGGGYLLADGVDRATLTAELDLGEPRETALGQVGPGGSFQAGGDWAFAPSPRFHLQWTARGQPIHHLRFDEGAVDRIAETDLTVGQRFVYLGPHRVETRTLDGQELRIVVPEGVEFRVGVDRSADLLAAVQSETGTQADGAITAFVLPEQVRAGGASSGADVWVRSDVGEVTVAHEFAHASVTLHTTAETQWLREASAEYLAFRVVDGENATESTFAARVRHTDATLDDSATWPSRQVPYQSGAWVLASLDARLAAGDTGLTVGSLLGQLSAESSLDDPLTNDRIADAVESSGDEQSARWLADAVSTPQSATTANGASTSDSAVSTAPPASVRVSSA